MLASDDVPCAWGVQAVCLHAPTSHYYFWDPAGFTGDGSVENFQRRCQTEFRAPIPDTWRRYSKGGEWLFGLTCFQPLHWYWSTITWNNDPGADQQVSWLELALDFHASTRCALLRPEQDPATQTAFTMALFFEGASKRLGKICQQTVYPGEAVEHVNALTALGFGRASGLTKRPCLHQPEYVHKVLGEIALTRAKGALKFRQLKIDLPPAPIIKYAPFQRRRLTGKQAAPAAYQTQKARRKLTSFKALLADVQWTPQELESINQANGWREKQRLEKKNHHNNRTAHAERKHVLEVSLPGQVAKCSVCQRTNINIGRLMKEACGGEQDTQHQQPGSRLARPSTKLFKRIAIAQEHNRNNTTGHIILEPSSVDELPTCAVCSAQQTWQGWKRIQRFMRQTCPMAS